MLILNCSEQADRLSWSIDLENSCWLDSSWEIGVMETHLLVPSADIGVYVTMAAGKPIVTRVSFPNQRIWSFATLINANFLLQIFFDQFVKPLYYISNHCLKVLPGGVAAEDGKIETGDTITHINSKLVVQLSNRYIRE